MPPPNDHTPLPWDYSWFEPNQGYVIREGADIVAVVNGNREKYAHEIVAAHNSLNTHQQLQQRVTELTGVLEQLLEGLIPEGDQNLQDWPVAFAKVIEKARAALVRGSK